MQIDANRRIIFALDISDDLNAVASWVRRLKGYVGLFKIGKELFTKYGPPVVKLVQNEGCGVFLDLKYHDIPTTVARASEGAVGLGVAMFNLHALGGKEMMAQAIKAASLKAEKEKKKRPTILAVTVLTSLNDRDLAELGFTLPAAQLVKKLAQLAKESGIDGIICSPQEIAMVREVCGPDLLVVTPGVRRTNEVGKDDQKRTLTAREAIAAGADYLVIGRPIREAEDPVLEAESLIEEIKAGLREKELCRPFTG